MIAFGLVAILGGAGLLLAAGSDQRTTAFSLDIPANHVVAKLAPGQRVCQGPFTAAAAFAGLQVWTYRVPAAGAALGVVVRDATTGRPVTERVMLRASQPGTWATRLPVTVARGRRLSICLFNQSPFAVRVLGSAPGASSGVLRGTPTAEVRGGPGIPRRRAMSIVLLRPHPISLLDSLPAGFRRAALFRPTWVGAWTFWGLLALLLAAFPVGAAVIAAAARADREDDQA